MNKPSLFTALTGNLAGFLILLALSGLLILGYVSSPVPMSDWPPIIAIMLGMIAFRSRGEVVKYKKFTAEWRQMSGEPPKSGWRLPSSNALLLLLPVAGYGCLYLAGMPAAHVYDARLEAYVLSDAGRFFAFLGLGLWASTVGLALYKVVRFWKRRQHARDSGQRMLDGKPLPNALVAQALGIPMFAPAAAAAAGAVPDYCAALLHSALPDFSSTPPTRVAPSAAGSQPPSTAAEIRLTGWSARAKEWEDRNIGGAIAFLDRSRDWERKIGHQIANLPRWVEAAVLIAVGLAVAFYQHVIEPKLHHAAVRNVPAQSSQVEPSAEARRKADELIREMPGPAPRKQAERPRALVIPPAPPPERFPYVPGATD